MSDPKLGETIYLDFITNSSTGAAVDADSTPTAEVFANATDTTVVALTVTKRTSKTGNYRIAVPCTTGNGFAVDTSYNVVASATVSGVVAKNAVATFIVRANIVADVPALVFDTASTAESYTFRQLLRLFFSSLTGKLSGAATTTISIRDQADTKNRIVATVDSNGNRSAVTLDAT